MKPYTLPRTGDRPLQFTGELIAQAIEEPRRPDKATRNRHWHELTLYRTNTDKFVVAITYRSDWKGESHRQTVWWTDSQESLVDYLTGHELEPDGSEFYDPTAAAVPLASPDLNRLMMESIHDDFSHRVSAIFEALKITEKI